jgi:prevent-host-death family protein
VFVLTSNDKGNIAEAAFTFHATRCGIPVLRPQYEHGPYDLVLEIDDALLRVQIKWGAYHADGEIVCVRVGRSRHTPRGYVTRKYTADEVDAVGVYCRDLDRCYLIPMEVAAEKYMLHLRLGPAKNAQRAALNWAADYELSGAVAQLGRAFGWQPKGRGFESHQLHSRNERAEFVTVGAHEFREHFGWYMERASGGESFLITRRGKPYARLSPQHDQLEIPTEAPELEQPEPAEVVPITAVSERSG